MGAITFAMPRKPAATGGLSALNIIPFLFSLVALILILLILVAGSRPGVIDELSFLSVSRLRVVTRSVPADDPTYQVGVSSLSISAKLSSSRFLQDLSTVSRSDYVGQPVTASSLGLASYYTITAFGSCAHGTSTTCTTPQVGYVFDPRYDLKLEQTSASSQFTPDLPSAVSAYHKSAVFLGLAYIVSMVLVVVAPILSAVRSRFSSAGFLGIIISCLASLILIAVTVLSEAGALKQLNNAINDSYGDIGVHSSIGKLSILSWVATACSFFATAFYLFRASRHPVGPYGYGEQARGEVAMGDGMPQTKSSLWGKVSTFSNHRYIQIGKQHTVARTTGVRGQETVVMDPMIDDDHYTDGQPKSIQLMSLHKGGKKNLNTGYEPYTRQT